MKTITKKIMTSAISAVISLTAVAAFTTPATPVLAASVNQGQYSRNDYRSDIEQYNIKKAEGIRFLENCVSDPSPAAQYLINSYSWTINNHSYNIETTYEQNYRELVRYVNNVYKNIIYADNSSKLETYKAEKLEALYLLCDSFEDQELVNYCAYAFSSIVYKRGDSLEQRERDIDQLVAIVEAELI